MHAVLLLKYFFAQHRPLRPFPSCFLRSRIAPSITVVFLSLYSPFTYHRGSLSILQSAPRLCVLLFRVYLFALHSSPQICYAAGNHHLRLPFPAKRTFVFMPCTLQNTTDFPSAHSWNCRTIKREKQVSSQRHKISCNNCAWKILKSTWAPLL